MKSRTEETRRFPFIPLSVSDWLIRKHHPIGDEQTAFGAVRVGLREHPSENHAVLNYEST